jgi:hypothetical protein
MPNALSLDGPWSVQFGDSSPPLVRSMEQLRSWHEHEDPEIRFYSGTARYANAFRLTATRGLRWIIEPGAFANVIRIIVNDKDLGVLWIPETGVDATEALRPGVNTIVIVVANTWRNRLVGDRERAPDERSTWLMPNRLGARPPVTLAADAELLTAGLLGPVRITPRFRQAIVV